MIFERCIAHRCPGMAVRCLRVPAVVGLGEAGHDGVTLVHRIPPGKQVACRSHPRHRCPGGSVGLEGALTGRFV
jgi:hypothetical protein